jgi:uncharacterized integral membrane protein (TIGR00698 family)
MRVKPVFSSIPGLILALVVALAARQAHWLLPNSVASAISPVLLAVLLGLLLGNVRRLPASFESGIRFAYQSLLRWAIVLLGASLSLETVLSIGGRALMMVVVLMTLALVLAHLLGKALGIPGKLATLLGVGTAVCGNTAISATAPVIGAEERHLTLAIATNTLFGTIAVFVYPLLGRALGFDDATFGSWAGLAVNDTSQVVATGFAFSETAGHLATTVKLTRNALMAFVIVLMAVLYRSDGSGGGQSVSFWRHLRRSIPLFVLGFLSLSAARTLGWIDALGDWIHRPLAEDLKTTAKFLTVVALAGVGLSTQISTMRQTGPRPVLLGLGVALCVSLASLALIAWFGPLGG